MGVMGSAAVLCVLVTMLVLVASVQAEFDGYDGMPRPPGMDQDPTTTYGPKPAVTYNNKAANCIWYGWENGNYPPAGTHNCSTSLWLSLSHANPADLAGFMYYIPQDSIYYDPNYNEYLCAIGCFDLAASGPSPSSTPVADSPGSSIAPPAIPPASSAPPPAMTIAPPPPATLFRPPPPPATLPPSAIPVAAPSAVPVTAPSAVPVLAPSAVPVMAPSSVPVKAPSVIPSVSSAPSPGSSPGAQAPGPSAVQTGAGATTSVSTVLVLAVLLINFLV